MGHGWGVVAAKQANAARLCSAYVDAAGGSAPGLEASALGDVRALNVDLAPYLVQVTPSPMDHAPPRLGLTVWLASVSVEADDDAVSSLAGTSRLEVVHDRVQMRGQRGGLLAGQAQHAMVE